MPTKARRPCSYPGCPTLAILHVLKSLLKNGDGAEYSYAYLQKALDVENGKHNARHHEAMAEEYKKPLSANEMTSLVAILNSIPKG